MEAVGDQIGVHMGTGTAIKSGAADAIDSQALFVKKATPLKSKLIDFEMKSNLSVVSHADSTYTEFVGALGKMKAALLKDANNIGLIGQEFKDLDLFLSSEVQTKL